MSLRFSLQTADDILDMEDRVADIEVELEMLSRRIAADSPDDEPLGVLLVRRCDLIRERADLLEVLERFNNEEGS